MGRTGRPRIRVHADLRGLPGTEHLHVVVAQAGGAPAGAVELALEDPGDGPWSTPPEPHPFRLEAGQQRWAAFGVEPHLAPGRRFVFDLVLRGDAVRVRRRYRLEEHGGHWRLRAGNRLLHRRPRPAPAETSNAGTR